jgi:predicted GIY-YIG superfamily endonuclease
MDIEKALSLYQKTPAPASQAIHFNLVFYEFTDDVHTALAREKQIKAGSRQKKISLIEDTNPDWRDLYEEI